MDKRFAEVSAVLERYYDGLYRCDIKQLGDVFHPEAQYVTASSGELVHLDMKTYLPLVEARRSPETAGEPWRLEIDGIEFAGPVTAFAKLRCSMLSNDYTDFLTLVKLDGAWRVISKTFHVEPQSTKHNQEPNSALRQYQDHP